MAIRFLTTEPDGSPVKPGRFFTGLEETAGLEKAGLEVPGQEIAGLEIPGLEITGLEDAGLDFHGQVRLDLILRPILDRFLNGRLWFENILTIP